MGSSSTHELQDCIGDYEELTYLSRAEIYSLFKTFESIKEKIGAEEVPTLRIRIPFEHIVEKFAQIKNNPFSDRLCKVFSSRGDSCFSFEDILDLFSAMSENCSVKTKAAWAFRIYDFDGDNKINKDDIIQIILRMTTPSNDTNVTKYGQVLQEEQKLKIAEVLLSEMDLETTGEINQLAFEHGVGKLSEFPLAFSFRA